MKNVYPLKAARRRLQRQAVLKTDNPCCVICGETAIECLEVHEIAGSRRDPDTQVIVCRNCHRKQTIRLMDAGIDMIREEDPRTRVCQWMRANSVFLRDLADNWERQANLLDRLESDHDN
jgi:5-methylcytosine-specific restriction endonuclease McrA